MTKNLQALFTQATQGPWEVVRDKESHAYIDAKFIGVAGPQCTVQTALCGKPGDKVAEANAKLIALLATHGEALITALEEALYELERLGVGDCDAELGPNTVVLQTRQFLATLEREAGGQP